MGASTDLMMELGRHRCGSAAVSLAIGQSFFHLPGPCCGAWSGHHEIAPATLPDDPAQCSQDIPYDVMGEEALALACMLGAQLWCGYLSRSTAEALQAMQCSAGFKCILLAAGLWWPAVP